MKTPNWPLLICFLFFSFSISAQVNFQKSNLPIIVIETVGSGVPEEPKVAARMGILYNGPGSVNHIEDEWNEYNGWIGIELRGQTSNFFFPKKPYAVETRDENGENNNVSLLGMPRENDWVLHNPYSDKSLIRNTLTYLLAGKIMDYAPRVRLVELVLNGEYQGVYLLTEKIKRDKFRVDVSTLEEDTEDITGGYILKFDKGDPSEIGWSSFYPPLPGSYQQTNFLFHYPKPEDITPEQANYIQNHFTAFEDALMGPDSRDPQLGYRPYIDVSTFVNFFLVNELARNVDGYRLSTFFYKDRDEVDPRIKMGPVWDFNLGFGNANYCEGGNYIGWAYNFNNFCPEDNWVVPIWWRQLMADDYFQQQLYDRWKEIRANEWSDEVIFGAIDSLARLLKTDFASNRNFQTWPVLNEWIWPNNFVGGSYDAEINYLENWTRNRLLWLDGAIGNLVSTTTAPLEEAITIYPNPASTEVTFDYATNSTFRPRVKIYNAFGQLVDILSIDEDDRPLHYQHKWTRIPSPGIYFYQVVALNEVRFTGKLIVAN